MDVALLDIVALIVLAAGLLQGLLRGLGPSFGLLLWLVLALWLSNVLAPQVLSWMPESGDPRDPADVTATYGVMAAVLVLLPAVAQLLGGSGGRKKTDPEPTYRFSGVIVGVVSSLLVLAWLTPYTERMDAFSRGLRHSVTPSVASGVARTASWLYPAGHRKALQRMADRAEPPSLGGSGK